MSDDEVRVIPQALRASADEWFPRMSQVTANAESCMSDSIWRSGAAFLGADAFNGGAWVLLMEDLTAALKASAVRLEAAQATLRSAAASYEDSDVRSAQRIETVSR